jgi:predicted RNA binding protein YcfA (HicA-like mRNA interferase family)
MTLSPAVLVCSIPLFLRILLALCQCVSPKILENDGWYLVRTKGSHRQFKHQTKLGLVTVAGKPSDDMASGTQNSIFKQAGLKK